MLDTYTGIATNLFSYREFHGLFVVFRGLLWVTLALIVIILILHILFMLGYQSPLYRKRSPSARAAKAFVRGNLTIAVIVLFALTGCEWVESNLIPAVSARSSIITPPAAR